MNLLPAILAVAWISLLRGVSSAYLEKKDFVKLTLFYESYCPESIQFFMNQLYPTWEELKDNIKLDLVPFGNAQQSYVDGHFVFTCQHGSKECVANILHACAIDQACGGKQSLKCTVDQLQKAMDYINCVMGQTDQQAASNKCATQVGLDSNTINTCANGNNGEVLESGYGNRTAAFHHPKVTYVPFIVINNKHTEKQQQAAEDDLKSVICTYIPDHCK